MKFKAAILTEQNAPLIVDEIETDTIGEHGIGFGQVLVKIACSGICGAQLGEIAGVKGKDWNLPHLLGHEGAGTVEAVGLGVGMMHRGDRIVMHWRKGAGIESRPPRYKWRGRDIGGGWVTTFNEYALVSENRLTRIDNDIPFETAALMGCAVTTALGLINNDAQLKIGQSIAVIGCGGVGLNVIQGAALVAGNPIIGVDQYPNKTRMAHEFGATHTFSSIEDVRSCVGDYGVDVVVETTGKVELIEKAYELTARSGKTILVGQMRFDHKASIQTLPMHAGKTLFASEGGQTDPTVDIPRYLRLYRSGRLQLDKLITHTFPLEQVNGALDLIRGGQVGRCLLTMAAK